jgi:hypothetical protein
LGGSEFFGLRSSYSLSLGLLTPPCYFLLLRPFLGFRSQSSFFPLLCLSHDFSLARGFSVGSSL